MDEILEAAGIFLEVIEFLRDSMAEHLHARLDRGIGLAGFFHRGEGQAFTVVLVFEFPVGKGVEDIGILPVLDASHRLGWPADGVIDLGENDIAAGLVATFEQGDEGATVEPGG